VPRAGYSDQADELPPQREARPAVSRAAPEPPEPDDELLGETDDVHTEGGGDVPTHKKIPTWQEAVGLLIEANLAARGADRDRGRGRGRR
jgi:hypothetical protein